MKRRPMTLGLLLLASACASGTQHAAPAAAAASKPAAAIAPGLVDGRAAHELWAAGVKFVDVRTAEEFQAGHIPGALNIPHDQMARRHQELGPPSTPVLVYCGTGRRSGIAASVLHEHGFTDVYDLQSYERWVASEPIDRAR